MFQDFFEEKSIGGMNRLSVISFFIFPKVWTKTHVIC